MLSVCMSMYMFVCVWERLWSKLWSPTPVVCPSGRHFPLTFNSCTRLLITDMLVSLVGCSLDEENVLSKRSVDFLRSRRTSIFLVQAVSWKKNNAMWKHLLIFFNFPTRPRNLLFWLQPAILTYDFIEVQSDPR